VACNVAADKDAVAIGVGRSVAAAVVDGDSTAVVDSHSAWATAEEDGGRRGTPAVSATGGTSVALAACVVDRARPASDGSSWLPAEELQTAAVTQDPLSRLWARE